MAAWFPYDVHVLVASLVYLLWYYFNNIYKKFKVANVPYLEPIIPFGNITKSTFRRQHVVNDITDVYNKFPDHRYVGYFQLNQSLIILRDPDMIKQITVKDFDYFLNHQAFVIEEIDPLFGKNLFSLKDNKWRNMRSTISPAFTGSKMKNMCCFMSECAKQVNNYIMNDIKGRKDGVKKSEPMELKDLCTRYTSDVIATTAFGVKVDSFNEKENEFYMTAKNSIKFDGINMLKFFGYQICPKIMTFFNLRLFSEECCNFYRHLVQDTMAHREKENIYRPDMIHLLMEAKKGTLKNDEHTNDGKAGFATVEESNVLTRSKKTKWEDDDLTAQALLFFLAGFDTAANLICFILYELGVDYSIQKKLQDEIDSSIANKGEVLTYEIMQKLTYLDMVVSETLRKWPPSVITDRVCTKEYDLGPSKEGANNNYKIKVGEILWLPIHAIHLDPEFWPNPDKFDPERFSEENKKNIRPYTYLPFGAGPRNCIGSRYALMEAKVMVYYILSQFNVEINAKTPVPLKLVLSSFNLKASGGFWVNFVPRK